jgi:hypothetical protein
VTQLYRSTPEAACRAVTSAPPPLPDDTTHLAPPHAGQLATITPCLKVLVHSAAITPLP